MLRIQSLHKSFGKQEILKDINLTFESGKVNGIVGKNGAGKTTLFRCICGLEDYIGRLEYEGGKLQNVLGFLPTTPYFLSKMTALEYLQLVCNGRQIPLPNLAESNIFELPLDQYAATYSTGMKKKLALTALLLQKNEVFILDEPFNGIDIQSNLLIVKIIEELKSLGKIIILSSHIFSTLEQICDQLHYLEKGQIKQSTKDKNTFKEIELQMSSGMIEEKIARLNLI